MKAPGITYVAPSRIHGKGLFARIRIRKGTYLGTYSGPVARKNGTHVLWVHDARNRLVGRRGTNKLRYVNHSDKPNAEFDGFDLYSIKTIYPDEEITINYNP